MTQLLDIFGFLSVLLRGFSLAFEALTIGGVIFISLNAYQLAETGVVRAVVRWVRCSALLLLATQTSLVAANSAILLGSTDLKLVDVIGAGFWRAALSIVGGCLAIIVFARTRWWKASSLIACVLILLGSVLTSHSSARMEHRWFLMAATLIHHLAGGAWIGGLPYLLIALRQSDVAANRIVARFSTVAMLSVTLLVSAGASLAFLFVRFPPAAFETTYGLMLLAKVILTAILLLLGALNWKIVRAMRRKGDPDMLPLRHFAEAEIGIGFTVLLAAASLTSTPPAVDVAAGRVTPDEIAGRMKPRFPRLNTPSFAELSPATSLNLNERSALPGSFVPGQQQQINLPPDIAWSEYNHHWAGLVLLTIGLLAILARTFAWRWARHWPLAFLGLAVFLLIRADSENWPLGPRGFWESFQVAEVAQHRLFVVLVVAFAVFEWAVQTNRVARGRAAFVFPLVCAVGGALLMTHSHSLGNVKEEFLAELSHLPLALCAVFAGWSRWLELRGSQTRIASAIWPVCFLCIGVILVLYRET
jgi:putative copper resistance protein D